MIQKTFKLSRKKLALAVSLVGAVAPATSFALVNGEVLVGYSLGYDDNISNGNQDQGQEEDISNELYTEIDLTKDQGFFRYDIFGHVGFLSHSSNVTDDQLNVSGGIDALWLIKPNRFSWDFSDTAFLQRRNSYELASSSNTEQINVLRTGPTLYFHPTGRTYLNVGGYYEQTYAEFGYDSQYLGLNADSAYYASELTQLQLNVSEVHYMPDDDNFSDQYTRSAALQLRHRLDRGVWYIGAGASQIVIDNSGISEDSDVIPTYTAGYVYEIARRVELDIVAERQIVTFGQDTLNNTSDRASLISYLGESQQQQNSGTSVIDPATIGELTQELDDFQYSTGFNVDDTIRVGLNWRYGQWGTQFRVFARRLEVPEFQLDLSQEARQLLFPEGTLDAGQDSYGIEWTLSLEPKVRWLVDAGIRIEERKIESLDVLADDATFGETTTREVRESMFTSRVSFAATRYLSFGASLESILLEDKDDGDETQSNRIFFMVEYSL